MPRTTPPAPPTPPESGNPRDIMSGMMGNLQDDRSRRRRNRPQPEEDDDLQIDCLVKKKPDTTFEDIGGNDEAKTELMEIAKAIKCPESYNRFGAYLPKGILMTGKPGVGKTYMTAALANALNAPFYHVQVSNVVSMWFGQSEKNLQKIFDHAKMYCRGEIEVGADGKVKKWDPDEWAQTREQELLEAQQVEEPPAVEGRQNRERATRRLRGADIRTQIRQELAQRDNLLKERYAIIFFDEIDALGACRENTPFQGGVSNRIVSVLLENMDGLEAEEKIVVVASTNRIYAVDSALRRAGRFDRLIKIKKPDRATRAKIMEIHAKKAEKTASREFCQINFTEVAMETSGMVGADMAELVRKACQEQAKKWRDAPEAERPKFETISTEDMIACVKNYKSGLRAKDPDAPKGKIGFKPNKPLQATKSEEVVEEDLDGDDNKTCYPEPDEDGAEELEEEL